MSSTFWFDNFKILFQNMNEFYPTYNMNLIEKLNAIARLSIYMGIILTLVCKNYLYLYIPLGVSIFTIFIYKMQKNNTEKFFKDYDKISNGEVLEDNGNICVKPTVDNPFMNFNQITDSRFRPEACKSYDNKEIKKDIEKKFNYNLYRDVGDLYGKNNSQREFITMPVTTAIPDQTAFSKYLYSTGPTAKEDTIKNAPEWGESILANEQIFEPFVNN